jgi:hypothetical protein
LLLGAALAAASRPAAKTPAVPLASADIAANAALESGAGAGSCEEPPRPRPKRRPEPAGCVDASVVGPGVGHGP